MLARHSERLTSKPEGLISQQLYLYGPVMIRNTYWGKKGSSSMSLTTKHETSLYSLPSGLIEK